MYINCQYCGENVRVADDVIEVVCSNCFMRQAEVVDQKEKAVLDEYDPKQLKKLRKEKDLTQKDLSMITGVSVVYISQFESGHRRCPKDLADWIDANST